MSVCYIVGASPQGALHFDAQPGDLVIAADGGYEYLRSRGMRADILIGDFDSLDFTPPDIPIIRHPARKDDTDTMLAVKHAIACGCRDIRLYGCGGGRLDHTLANIQTLCYAAERGACAQIIGKDCRIIVVKNDTVEFGADARGIVSVFCAGDEARGVSIKGLKYPLDRAVLTYSFPLGVSNEFTGTESSITVRDGTIIVIINEGFTEK